MNWIRFDRRFLKQIDWWIIGALLVLTGFGILVIDGTTYAVPLKQGFAKRQLMWWGLSVAAFLAILLFDYAKLIKPAYAAYGLLLAMLVGLLVLPDGHPLLARVGGARSWYDFVVVRFQPSEFMKIAVILVAAGYLSSIKGRLPGWFDLAVVAAIVIVPVGLIAVQPDFGTAAVFLPTIFVMTWAAGAPKRIFAVIALCGMLFVAGYFTVVMARNGDYPLLKNYQANRVKSFLAGVLPEPLNQWQRLGLDEVMRTTDWSPKQAKIAIGSGGMWGKNWRKGTQTRLEFLPEAHSDYIFASTGEQFGFAGCFFVLALYALLVYRSLEQALRSKDWFGYLLVIGVICIFSTHVFLNIGVATDLLPSTGLPLPFLSAGGSFLLTTYIGFALVVNVGMRRYWF